MSTGAIIFISTFIKGVILTFWEMRKKRLADRKGVVLDDCAPHVEVKQARGRRLDAPF